jgi:hypothetical protein
MKRLTSAAVLALLATFMALPGCAFSAADRDAIIAASVEQAGKTSEATVFAKVEAELLRQGKTAEEARSQAAAAAGIAKTAAETVAGQTASIATAKASAERSNSAGSWITALLPALLGLVGAAAKKGLGV